MANSIFLILNLFPFQSSCLLSRTALSTAVANASSSRDARVYAVANAGTFGGCEGGDQLESDSVGWQCGTEVRDGKFTCRLLLWW